MLFTTEVVTNCYKRPLSEVVIPEGYTAVRDSAGQYVYRLPNKNDPHEYFLMPHAFTGAVLTARQSGLGSNIQHFEGKRMIVVKASADNIYGVPLETLKAPDGYKFLTDSGKVVLRTPTKYEEFLHQNRVAVSCTGSSTYISSPDTRRVILIRVPIGKEPGAKIIEIGTNPPNVYGTPWYLVKDPKGFKRRLHDGYYITVRPPQVGEYFIGAKGDANLWEEGDKFSNPDKRRIILDKIEEVVPMQEQVKNFAPYTVPLVQLKAPMGFSFVTDDDGEVIHREPKKGEYYLSLQAHKASVLSTGTPYGSDKRRIILVAAGEAATSTPVSLYPNYGRTPEELIAERPGYQLLKTENGSYVYRNPLHNEYFLPLPSGEVIQSTCGLTYGKRLIVVPVVPPTTSKRMVFEQIGTEPRYAQTGEYYWMKETHKMVLSHYGPGLCKYPIYKLVEE